MNKKTLTIGIPCLNEAGNIGLLLVDILKQKPVNFDLKKVIVASDGSTDDTVKITRDFNNPILIAEDYQEQKGPAFRQNQIIQATNTDILVIFNGDVRLDSEMFLSELVSPIVEGSADLTASAVQEIPGITMFEKILNTGKKVEHLFFNNLNDGDNIYTCHGVARGFSRKFYSQISFKSSVGEDAYNYVFCIANGMSYSFRKNATVYYRSPINLKDYIKQIKRFSNSISEMSLRFGPELTNKIYSYDKKLAVGSYIKILMQEPVLLPLHTILMILTRLYVRFQVIETMDKWNTAKSTKTLGALV